MKSSIALALLGLLAATAAVGEEKVERFYGYGYELENDRFAFTEVTERRTVDEQWTTGTTTYYAADGRVLGRKTLDFTRDPFVPMYRLELADGNAEAITGIGDVIAMERTLPGKAPKRATEPKTGLIAADAGLPRLLRAHFPELRTGKTLALRVVAPSRLDTFKFKARQAEDAAFEGKPATRIRVDMDSMLSLFAGPLWFSFDPGSGKLLEFRGMTNVVNPATGEPFKVRISYYSVPPKDAPKLPPM